MTHNPYWNAGGQRRWTDDEKQTLINMRAEGKTQAIIADALGRTEESIKNKINMMKLGPGPAKKARRPCKYNLRTDYTGEKVEQIVVPESVWADRNRRLNSGWRDLTAMLCGDPVTGQSALDLKQGRAFV